MKTDKPVAEINYQDVGEGDAVILLHGFLESSEIWEEYSDELEKAYRVIAIDLPGHGNSSMLNEIHSMDLMADEIRNIMEINGINKAVLVGHSMGGYVALAFAKKYTRFVKGIVLFHSHAGADSKIDKENRNRTIEILKKDHISYLTSFTEQLFAPQNVSKYRKEIQELRQIAVHTQKESVIAALAGMRDREDSVEFLQEAKFPVLYLAGEEDPRIPLDKVKEQAELTNKGFLKVVKGIGHMGFVEAKEECLKIIWDFIKSTYSRKK
jgi:pimeloyl-ACP methyl ester carboxylesterase